MIKRAAKGRGLNAVSEREAAVDEKRLAYDIGSQRRGLGAASVDHPHGAVRLRVDGVVSATKPLSYNGTLITDISMRFEGGKIVDMQASRGRDVLLKAMDSDEGGRRIGEVALVPHSSPISQSGILFYNTLFDENAASHIALGQCYSDCFVDGDTITPEEVEKRGGNKSVIHIDWMIGSDKIDIDGIKADGSKVPVMRKGEWATA